MRNNRPHVLIALVLLLIVSGAAGSVRASDLISMPAVEIFPAWEFYGYEQGDRLGYAVAGVGDVNGDNYSDIMVGADKGGVNREGWAGLFVGSASGPQQLPTWEVFGEKKGSEFGTALDGAGDINHDGYDDIVVGAANYMGTAPSDEAGEGAVYVYYGAASNIALTPGWKIEGDGQNVRLGAAVAGAGYINGDEYADVVVGMPYFSTDTLENIGAAYVYFGSATGLSTGYGWVDIGEQSSAQFGREVNPAGDVNHDGYGDVLVGEPYFDNDIYLDAGAVYLYMGNQFGLSNVPAWTYLGYRGEDRLGTTADAAGDLNGDGCDDIVLGAPGYNLPNLLNAGRVYVFYGCQTLSASTLNSVADWEYSFPQEYANTGIDASSGGDTNADGYDELLVGVDLFDDEQANEGAVFAFFGSEDGLALQPGWQVEGNKNETFFGFAVDGAGDTDGDGYTDVLIGSYGYRYEEIIRGGAFLYSGTAQTTYYFNYLPFVRKP
jgi:hypothetical protein